MKWLDEITHIIAKYILHLGTNQLAKQNFDLVNNFSYKT